MSTMYNVCNNNILLQSRGIIVDEKGHSLCRTFISDSASIVTVVMHVVLFAGYIDSFKAGKTLFYTLLCQRIYVYDFVGLNISGVSVSNFLLNSNGITRFASYRMHICVKKIAVFLTCS